MAGHLLEISYIAAIVLFVIGLKMLGHPATARKGNFIAGTGMGIAVIATFLLYRSPSHHYQPVGNYLWIFGGIIVGSIWGIVGAKRVAMTAMPQWVAMFNGMGGACSALIGLISFPQYINDTGATLALSTVFGSIVVGSITFSGSIIAYAKLNGNMNKDIRIPFYNIINTVFLIFIAGLCTCLLLHNIPDAPMWIYILLGISLVLAQFLYKEHLLSKMYPLCNLVAFFLVVALIFW